MLNVNNKALHKQTERLEKLHRSALPVAVRSTLNSAAFDVKTKTMPLSAKKAFVERKATFFKANSKVEQAKGFDVSKMKATVGFIPKGNASDAVNELEQQERGGSIGKRNFIALKGARAGKNWNKQVRADLRLSNLKNLNIIDADKVRFKNHGKRKGQKFIRAAIKAKQVFGSRAFVLGNKRGDGGRTLSKIDSVRVNRKAGTIKIKRTPIYTYRRGRKITVARTNFMKRASLESGIKIEKMFVDQALKQLKKIK